MDAETSAGAIKTIGFITGCGLMIVSIGFWLRGCWFFSQVRLKPDKIYVMVFAGENEMLAEVINKIEQGKARWFYAYVPILFVNMILLVFFIS